jgi:DNA-binding IclR family transcriptional regulator
LGSTSAQPDIDSRLVEERMSEIDLTRYQAPALNRGIDVLETLADHPEGLSPSQLSSMLALSTSQLFRILATLEHRGYVARVNGGECYVATLRLFAVAHRHTKIARLISLAEPMMRRIVKEVEQASQLSVRSGTRMVVIAYVPAPGLVSLVVPVGQEYSLIDSTAGLLHLAHEDEATQKTLIAEIESEPEPVAAPERLKELARLAKNTSFFEPSLFMEGGTMHSAVLCDCDRKPFASLTIPYVRWSHVRIGEDAVHEALRATAARLEAAIGGQA